MNHETSVVLLACQVDDFVLGCVDDNTARGIMPLISEHIQLPSEMKIPIIYQGVLTSFNGHDVIQTADYIQLSAESFYAESSRVMHGKSLPNVSPPSLFNPSPHSRMMRQKYFTL